MRSRTEAIPRAVTPRCEPTRLGRVGVYSVGMLRKIPDLAALIGADALVPFPVSARQVDCVAGWGRKKNTRIPRRIARAWGVPFVQIEDGFVRSVGLGVEGAPPLSLVVDRLGIYYDATRESELERALNEHHVSPEERARARRCIARIREARISKYNDAPVRTLGPTTRRRVLVVDQTANDLSIRLGRAPAGGFDALLDAAMRENPDAEILVKTHPDVLRSDKRGHLGARPGVRALTDVRNPIALLEEVDHVYVMTSLMGFEALLLGKEVTCFGAPFYAGWGLTDDRGDVPARRQRRRSLEELFAIAYLEYARYVDPESGAPCELERVVEHLALQRVAGRENARRTVCVGFSAWKRAFVPSFIRGPGMEVLFADDEAELLSLPALRPEDAVLVWGTREAESLRRRVAKSGAKLLRMEDGFLRSVGLGSDLHAPASLVVDDEGIYYDPSIPSALETIIARGDHDADELERAARLRERIVRARVSKYNTGEARRIGPGPSDPRELVLVIGQVEDDASIQKGCLDVRTNEALLRAARQARPEAYLVYKPHPDVVSGNRRDSLPLDGARRHCDEVVVDVALPACLDAAAEVHTMTSLVGFEALLREKRVVVYGQPFYAGWGLTEDRHPHPRRTRRVTLDELVAATLLCYPRYVHPRTQRYTTPEAIVDHLEAARRPRRSWLDATWAGRRLRKVVNLAKEISRAR